jgi:hypothetical protein
MKISEKQAIKVSEGLGVFLDKPELREFRRGVVVELEHTGTIKKFARPGYDELEIAGSIALDHLRELPDYYTRLKKMEGG